MPKVAYLFLSFSLVSVKPGVDNTLEKYDLSVGF
jgi:hypothetical protein